MNEPTKKHQPYEAHFEKISDTGSSTATGPAMVDYSKVFVVTS